jgi:uncharacterized protein
MALNLPTTVYEILRTHPNQKMTAREIATEVAIMKPDECNRKKENSHFTDAQLITQIVAEIASMKDLILRKDERIKTNDERPRKFMLDTENYENIQVETPEEERNDDTEEIENREKALYPKLCSYLWFNKKIFPKRIDEKKSINSRGKKGNIWLYPDIVGFEFLVSEFNSVVLDLLNEVDVEEKFSLYSYEVKLILTKSNIRESYFQAASNSSWANYGYLVCSAVNDDVLPECRILSNQFDIGLIILDNDEPTENSEILIQAKRNKLNWGSINRLYEQNTDFQNYLKIVKDIIKVNREIIQGWDIPEIETI